MGEMFGSFATPFGMDRKLFLFFAATGAIAYPVWPFLVAAVWAARNKVANMATLIVLSVGTGYLFSVGSTFFYDSEVFFEASAVLLVFILLGHWLEMRARAGASDAIRALMDLAPPMATVLRNGVEAQVPTAQVQAGETVVIKPGDKIPVDGEVTEGYTGTANTRATRKREGRLGSRARRRHRPCGPLHREGPRAGTRCRLLRRDSQALPRWSGSVTTRTTWCTTWAMRPACRCRAWPTTCATFEPTIAQVAFMNSTGFSGIAMPDSAAWSA